MSDNQLKRWTDAFGEQYTARNTFASVDDWNKVFVNRFGISKDGLNREFLDDLPRDARILEVGANIGNQLLALQRLGFKNLYGVEVQRHACDEAKTLAPGIDIVQGEASDLPFKDGFFDLVFTNNVLIHISPSRIASVYDEMHRVCRSYIWGAEYYADEHTEIKYRGQEDLLWKADFAQILLDRFEDLRLVKDRLLPYLDEQGNTDKMYLLKKVS